MFNKECFANIISKIKNTYDSQVEFSEKSGVGRTYLSQYMNMRLNNPPKPEILQRIADNSNGITTYEELMEICGYITVFNKNLIDTEHYKALLNEKAMIEHELDTLLSKLPKKLKKYYDEMSEIAVFSANNIKDKAETTQYIDKKFKELREKYKLAIWDELKIKDVQNLKLKLINLESSLLDSEIAYVAMQDEIQLIKIPVVGTVAAGEPILAQENIIDYEELPANEFKDGNYFGLKIKGNSMFPRILENDVVIIRQQTTAETGQIAVVLINGDEATVKQIKKMNSGIMLIPFNNKYEPIFFTNEEIEQKPVKIIGIVKRLIGYNFE